ncbi:MAG: helix-hairpin-helix domain-containing protein [Syntrophorhabdaceae bacterium]|nr:helix-hairpin-helix domain-containing protein [Syntrophorhabdaceae bacterium]
MPDQEKTRKNSIERKRSYLFLSMILLVWNLVATANHALQNSFQNLPQTPGETPVSAASKSLPPQTIIPETHEESISVRQKYLLGKQIDINKASIEEFSSLPGISSAMAAAIVEERERSGGFNSPNELMRVKGIKEKRLEKILPFLKKIAE